MKKLYENPQLEIEQFLFMDVLTTSPEGLESGDGVEDPFDD